MVKNFDSVLLTVVWPDNIWKFSPGGSILLRNIAPLMRKVFLQEFLPVLQPYSQKFWLGSLDHCATRWVTFVNVFLERVCFFGTLHQWCVTFLSRIFYPFWPSYGQKFWFSTFGHGATRWIKFNNFHLQRVFCFGTLHQWCIKFLFRIFYPSWPPYRRKF